MTNRTRVDFLLLAGFCAFLFFYGISKFGLIGADEPRYAQVAREMLERADWITPTLGGRPWLEKPPLYYWEAMMSYRIFGVSDWSARLPSAFDATLLVLALYFFLRKFFPRVALDGALILASCAGIVGYARAASTDMPLAATFSIALLCWWTWRETGNKLLLLLFFFFIALGMLAKGPVGPFLAGSVLLLYAAANREFRRLSETLWPPGMVLFCVIALPWYFLVQARNPGFFREFIVEQNLGRFSENLYHHVEPFWYYVPVTLVAVVPWTVFVIAGFVNAVRNWKKHRPSSSPGENRARDLGLFACCWLIVLVVFFSISQSKLPGYILPAIPAGALLLAIYLQKRVHEPQAGNPARLLIIFHALLAAAPLVPALLIAYLVMRNGLPVGRPLIVAVTIAAILCAAMALTLLRRDGLRFLRFITLIPVVLTVAAVLKFGSTAIDRTLSARPLARELADLETQPMPLAVYHVPRELEYGLTFYRNQLVINYAWGRIPADAHLLVAPEDSQIEVAKLVPGRHVSFLGEYSPQKLDYFWISRAEPAH